VSLQTIASTSSIIGYTQGISDLRDYAQKMQSIAGAAEAQQEKEDARFACYGGDRSSCTSLKELRHERDEKLQTPKRLPEPSSDVVRVDALASQILPLLPGYLRLSPQIFAYQSSCYRDTNAYSRAYYLERAGGTARKIDNVNDLHFYDVTKEALRDPSVPLYQELSAHHIAIQYQSAGNLYECPDSGFAVTDIGSLLGTLTLLQDASTTSAIQEVLQKTVVQKADLTPLVKKEAAQNSSFGDSLAEVYLEGSANFDEAVLGAYSDNFFLIRWNKEQKPVDYSFVFAARNFASMLFLVGNPTFVPSSGSFFTSTKPNPLGNLLLRSYLDDVSKNYSDAEILAEQKAFFGLETVINLDKP